MDTNNLRSFVFNEHSKNKINDDTANEIIRLLDEPNQESIPMQAVVIKMLAELWHELEDKRNLVISNLHLDDDGNEKPSSEIPEGEEMPEGFLGKIYRDQLIMLSNEYTTIMDSVNNIFVVVSSKHSL